MIFAKYAPCVASAKGKKRCFCSLLNLCNCASSIGRFICEKQVTQSQIAITSLKSEAEATAKQVKSAILADGKSEIERLSSTAKSQIATIEAKVRKQISDYVVTLALQRVTLQLEGKLGANLQQQIIDQNISKL